MHKSRSIFICLIALVCSFSIHAEEKRYISDELITYTHSGPGNQYRIVGALKAGAEVTLLSVNDNAGYAQIRDDKNHTSWIPLDQLSQTPSLSTRVPELENQVKVLTDKLNNIDQTWKQRTTAMQQKVDASDSIISGLQKNNQDLKAQLRSAQQKVSAASVQLDDKKRTLILQWFMYGGGVAGAGLLLGLLLPHLIPRRKKNDRWMG
ncbi:TIGR04211 family SH3 domain-containing protein [Brenneria uluponensis]|uniref:TIGR04211 family SH3 domain-containing protein n=1 Tax=Brenneria uluponensis TaxID=3057057 RepID=UPI0028E5CD4E|nr:TIGR04211 family SH3 domain-containing protein [Brenneria ulupoensis]